MKQKNTNKRGRSQPLRRLPLLLCLTAAASFAVGGATLISRHRASVASPRSVEASTERKYTTVKVAGRDVQVDPQTGQIRPLTPEEARHLAEGLKTMLNKSTEGLAQEQHPDGTVSMNLQDRFQNVTVARINTDGSVEHSCVDNPEAAASFFGIDPQLLGLQQRPGATTPAIHPARQKASQQ
jgi:hypothetical protein